jgi:putative flippase GtrA
VSQPQARSFLGRFIRFGLTGLFVTGVHFVVAIALVELLGASPPLANGVAFVTSTIISYVINTMWSFQTGFDRRTFARYVTVAGIGLTVAVSLAAILDRLGVHYILGICIITVTNPPLIFALHNFWTYRAAPAKPDGGA